MTFMKKKQCLQGAATLQASNLNQKHLSSKRLSLAVQEERNTAEWY